MKFDCGITPQERALNRRAREQAHIKYLANWHPWFAWYPVRLGSKDCRWLEIVERKYSGYEQWGTWHLISDWPPSYRAK